MRSNELVRSGYQILFAVTVFLGACAPAAPPSPTSAAKSGADSTTQTAKPAPIATEAPKPAAQGAPAVQPTAPVAPSVQRVVFATEPPRIEGNELRNLNIPDVWPLRPMYEYLIGVDPETGKLVPQLATEWTLEPDGKSFRFKLRRGVQFHQGHGEFTAKDVVHSWSDLVKQDSTHGQSGYWRALVTEIDVVNDYDVVFHLAKPDVNFLTAISEGDGGMEMRSKTHADAVGAPTMESSPIAGTGPYQFKERAQGQYLRFEKVPYQHWRVTPDFPEFEFRWQREHSTRMASLIAGEVHLASLPGDLLAESQSRGFSVVRGKVLAQRTYASYYCCFMKDPKDPAQGWMYPDSPLMDVRVRKALNKSIDRAALNKAFFGDRGIPLIVNNFNPSRPGWDPTWEARFADEYGYDPAKAKALLAEAGKSDLSTNMILIPGTPFTGAEDIVEAIAGYFRNVGVNVTLQPTDSAQLRNQTIQFRFPNHLYVTGTSIGQVLGATISNSSLDARGFGMEDPETDALLTTIRATFDEQKQEQLWRQFGEIIFSRHMNAPLFWVPAEVAINPKVVGGYVYPSSMTGTWTHVFNIQAAR